MTKCLTPTADVCPLFLGWRMATGLPESGTVIALVRIVKMLPLGMIYLGGKN